MAQNVSQMIRATADPKPNLLFILRTNSAKMAWDVMEKGHYNTQSGSVGIGRNAI